jgi:hypothetical protein
MEILEVSDLYEAAYLLVKGGRIEAVACIPVSAGAGCIFTVRGEGLRDAQEEYLEKKAAANLYAFRGAYTQVQGFMREAKKSFEREKRAWKREAL